MYINILFENFVEYLENIIKDKDIQKILDNYIRDDYFKNTTDDLDLYFTNDSLLINKHFFNFLISYKEISHTEYLKIEKNKFIEHALVTLCRKYR